MGRDYTIALFSVSAGTGHVRAAEAIRETAQWKSPGVRTVHLDVMDLVPPWFRRVYADSYAPLVERHRALWGCLYEKTDQRRIDSKTDRLRSALENLNTKMFRNALYDIAPDHVMCTHFLPAEILSGWRRKKKCLKPVWVVVTDFDLHSG